MLPRGVDEDLVSQVKQLQRNNPIAKEQWILYTETRGGGHRDPARHPPEFIKEFLTAFGNSAFGMVGSQGVLVNEETPDLSELITVIMKKSQLFKNSWTQFCSARGGQASSDPSQQDKLFQVSFFHALAASAVAGLQQQQVAAQQVPPEMLADNPAKRMRMDPGVGMGGAPPGMGAAGMGAAGSVLAQRVKEYQKTSIENKELWGLYADTFLGGIRDPSRHPDNILEEFCNNHGVPHLSPGAMARMQQGGMAAARPGHGPGGMPMPGMGGGAKAVLASKIKAFCSQGEESWEMWNTYSRGKLDPELHMFKDLKDFCEINGLMNLM